MSRLSQCISRKLGGAFGVLLAVCGTSAAHSAEARKVDFSVSSGTNMSVDVAPDERAVVFDLLGQIYEVPSRGGEARLLADAGSALNYHPSYSPDGRQIVFVSDRSGQDNLWIMARDGQGARPLLDDPVNRYTAPVWSADGKTVVAVRNAPTFIGMWRRSSRIVRIDVATKAVTVIGAPSDTQLAWPALDGRGRLYLTASDYTGSDSGAQSNYRVEAREPGGSGKVVDGAFAAEPSPDGRYLAFARHVAGGSVTYRGHEYAPRVALWIRDLATGEDRLVLDPISLDTTLAHAMYSLRVLPGYSWSNDGRSIYLSTDGKLKRLDVASGRLSEIPFKARVQRTASPMAKARLSVGDRMKSRFVQWPSANQRGDIAFGALGRLWLQSSGTSRSAAISSETDDVAIAPAWAPDGNRLAWAYWSDAARGGLAVTDTASGATARLSLAAGEYHYPCWGAGKDRLIAMRGAAARTGANPWSKADGWAIIAIDIRTGRNQTLAETKVPVRPTCANGRVFFTLEDAPVISPESTRTFPSKEELARRGTLFSVAESGGDRKAHLTVPVERDWRIGAAGFDAQLSPDGKHVAFSYALQTHVVATPRATASGLPFVDVAKAASGAEAFHADGLFHRWRADGQLELGQGARHVRLDPRTRTLQATALDLEAERTGARGDIALVGARIVPMVGDNVIERGDIVVRDRRIVCVGQCAIPPSAKRVDVAGKTIIPGLIDVHAHFTQQPLGAVLRRQPAASLYLSHGITTVRDPATNAAQVFPYLEAIEAGWSIAPRVFTSAEVIRGWGEHDILDTSKDADAVVARLADWGASLVKNYRLNRRDDQQRLVSAAEKRGLAVTSEGADLYTLVGMVLDGQTGFEHAIMQLPLREDAAKFFGGLGISYSPTVSVAGHGEGAFEYYKPRSNLIADSRYRRFGDQQALEQALDMAQPPLRRFSFPLVAEGLKDIVRAGGNGAIGDHSVEPGIGSHWEIWAYATAMPALDALRIATIGGARFIGVDGEIGTLEPGKLADLVVLDGNPLEDIRQTASTRMVMKDGVLRDAATLDEIWPAQRPYPANPWLGVRDAAAGPLPLDQQ